MNADEGQVTDQLADWLSAKVPPGEEVLVLTHDYPDPDALASACAVVALLEGLGRAGRIVFTGMVARAENRELLRQVRYRWSLAGRLRPRRDAVPAVFVDTAPWSGNVSVPDFCRPLAVIDHHPVRRKLPAGVYVEVRTGAGATATIMYDHLVRSGITIAPWLATIMVYAVASETMDILRDVSPDDISAYSALLAQCNFRALGRIRHASLPRDYYRMLREALDNTWTYGHTAWSHLARVRHPEIVAEIADLLLRMERVTWSFCTAIHGQRLLISLRSSRKGARCGRLLRLVVGSHGSAGGHHHTAAGYLPAEHGGMDTLRWRLTLEIVRRIEKRLPEEADIEKVAQRLEEA